ncbi:MAG: PQQ-like beta-propeller repeat protein [Acidobacteria bacterium]|nr:PQQ-like beta-propeller repeat protein [Acidobacteriota bacterium]
MEIHFSKIITVAGTWCLLFATVLLRPGGADWPMSGHDPQRTSHAPEDVMNPCVKPLWHKKFDAFIPSRSQIITMEGLNGAPDTLFVTTAAGIYALNPETGETRWFYQMDMPPGDSPSVAGNILYIPGTDKAIHAVDVINGTALWKTNEAGAPFYVNPLVVSGRLYTGSHDGYFYCFDASNGKLLWHFHVGEPIGFAAAYLVNSQYPSGVVFFAANDCRAYAIRADNGTLLWKSPQLPADRFVGYWPVVVANRILLASSTNYPVAEKHSLQILQREAFYSDSAEVRANMDDSGRLNLQRMLDYNQRFPARRTIFVLDSQTGQQAETAPYLWWGNCSGQRYPPAVGPGNVIWAMTPWVMSWFGTGRYIGWTIGSAFGQPLPGATAGDLESADEPEAYAIIGKYIYHNDGGDGQDKGGIFKLEGGTAGFWAGFSTFKAAFGNYWGRWAERKYGNNFKDGALWEGWTGIHGHQNPPIPLRGRVYFHRSNAVICMAP